MYKEHEETFTNDLRYRNETVSLNQDEFEFLLEEQKTNENSFIKEDLELVWETLKSMYGQTDDRYILIYLIYYLGYSYRDAAETIGIVVSWRHKLTEKTIKAVRRELINNGKLIN